MFKRYLTLEQQQRLMSTVRKFGSHEARRDYGWMRLLRACGLRVGEASKLTVGQAQTALSTGYVYIPRADRKGQRRDHTVRVVEEAHAAIRDLLTVRQLITGEQLPEAQAPLILNRYGRRLSIRGFQLRMEYWAHEAGITERVSPHWLRHTRAMNIMRHSDAKDPRGIVQSVLGHASLNSTGIYTQPSKEDVEAALRKSDMVVGGLRKRDMRRLHAIGVPA